MARDEAKKHSKEFDAVKEELQEKAGALAERHTRVMDAYTAYTEGLTTRDQFHEVEAAERNGMLQTLMEMDDLKPAISSLAAIFKAIDGQKLKKLGAAVYAAIHAAIATATSRVAATTAIGLNFGNQASRSLRGFVLPLTQRFLHRHLALSPTAEKKVRALVATVGAVGGLFFAARLQNLALALATVYFGTGAFLTTLADVLSSGTSNLNLPQDETPVFSTLHIGLTAIALIGQLRGAVPFPGPLRLLFSPIALLERYLRALTFQNIAVPSGIQALF